VKLTVKATQKAKILSISGQIAGIYFSNKKNTVKCVKFAAAATLKNLILEGILFKRFNAI
jgi:hypothetical protein